MSSTRQVKFHSAQKKPVEVSRESLGNQHADKAIAQYGLGNEDTTVLAQRMQETAQLNRSDLRYNAEVQAVFEIIFSRLIYTLTEQTKANATHVILEDIKEAILDTLEDQDLSAWIQAILDRISLEDFFGDDLEQVVETAIDAAAREEYSKVELCLIATNTSQHRLGVMNDHDGIDDYEQAVIDQLVSRVADAVMSTIKYDELGLGTETLGGRITLQPNILDGQDVHTLLHDLLIAVEQMEAGTREPSPQSAQPVQP